MSQNILFELFVQFTSEHVTMNRIERHSLNIIIPGGHHSKLLSLTSLPKKGKFTKQLSWAQFNIAPNTIYEGQSKLFTTIWLQFNFWFFMFLYLLQSATNKAIMEALGLVPDSDQDCKLYPPPVTIFWIPLKIWFVEFSGRQLCWY